MNGRTFLPCRKGQESWLQASRQASQQALPAASSNLFAGNQKVTMATRKQASKAWPRCDGVSFSKQQAAASPKDPFFFFGPSHRWWPVAAWYGLGHRHVASPALSMTHFFASCPRLHRSTLTEHENRPAATTCSYSAAFVTANPWN